MGSWQLLPRYFSTNYLATVSMQLFSRLRDLLRRVFARGGASRSPLQLAQRQVITVRGSRAIPSLAQWRELPRYLSQGEKRIFTIALFGVIIAGGLLTYRFFATNQTTVAAVGGSYTEGLIGTPQYMNPLYAVASDTDTDLTRLVFSGLVRFDPAAGLVVDLAESYTVSEDQKTYTFTLHDNAFWHDGAKVTPEDVVFTIGAIQNPEYRSPLAISFSGVAVQAVDERTVTFTLAEPFAPFLSTLTVGILPAHIWQDIPPSSAQLARRNLEDVVGSGPYMLEKKTQDQKGTIRTIMLVRNPNFYRGAPFIEELNFKFYSDASALAEALKNRNVEGAGFVPFAAADELVDDRLQAVMPSLSQYTAAFLNDAHTSILTDVKVRQALALATNRETIVGEALGGKGLAITSPILPSMPGYDATIGATNYDLAGAIALLESAGWKLEEGATVRTKSSTALAFTMTTVDTAELTAVATLLKEQWAQAGVELTIVAVDPTTLQNDILKNRNYDILLAGELYGTDQDPYAFWHSSQVASGLNVAQFASRKADDAIEAARKTTDVLARAESYKTLATIIAEEYPAVFLYQPSYTYLTTSRIQNIIVPTITVPADRFANINEWYIKTRKVFGEQNANEVIETVTEAPIEATTETPVETTTEAPVN